ncbi:glycosyltransferase family 2 protein, partial [Acidithiobacillus sp.]|uniref:glycosyltransferase family 2 protein n=1 Tax=Acidithiobacillus sp. TaxID=1872118 RepID=UPI003CFD6D8E
MPLVSVIIPAYNSGPYLDEAVRSVVAQTFTDWECIVVDDGSTEDLSRIEKMGPRVRLIRQENRGISMARNRGIAESTGEFVAFLDHDDAFLPTKLERQVAAMSRGANIGLCHTDFAVMDEKGDSDLVPSGSNTATDFLAMLEFGAPFPTTTVVTRRALELLGVFDPFLTPSEDQDLFIRIARFFRVVRVSSCEA